MSDFEHGEIAYRETVRKVAAVREKALADARAEIDRLREMIVQMEYKNLTVRKQLEKARAAFERYASHEPDCVEEPWHGKGVITCSCGFYDAMIALTNEEGKQ